MKAEQIIEGPGSQAIETYILEIAIIVIGAFILGYVLRWLLNDKYKEQIKKHEFDMSMLKLKSKPEESFEKLEKTVIEQQKEIDKLKTSLGFARTDKEDALSSLLKVKQELESLKTAPKKEDKPKPPQPPQPPKAPKPSTPVIEEEIVLATSSKDDLKIIEGIGPKIEQILNKAEIATLRDLVSKEVSYIKQVLIAEGPTYAVHDPATWAEQAKLAIANQWEELKELQKVLKGGKRK
jgi:predicted flap endonuclease-1-like 5' DNA nuclease